MASKEDPPKGSATPQAPTSPQQTASNSAPANPTRPANKDGRRARNLLKDFYGAKEDQVITPDNDPGNINGPGFDAARHFDELLKTNNLPQLIQRDNTMAIEIRKLDSDMKTLVYENYNKFISATETIRKMKSNVENMEEEMNRLAENMKKISECSDHINAALSTRRDKIEQLSGVHKLLKKLQFLVELPSRLRRSIELEAYSQAVKYYSLTSEILRRYNHLSSFQAIQRDCEQIMSQLREKLKSKMRDSKMPAPAVTEAVGLLLELNESALELRKDYLDCRRANLESLLNKFAGNSRATGIQALLTDLDKQFLFDFLECSKCFKILFIDREESGTNKKEATTQLEGFTRHLLSQYFTVVRTVLISEETKTATNDMVQGLEILHRDFASVHVQLPELAISDRAADMINSIVQKHMENLFNDLKNSVRASIQKMSMDTSDPNQTCKTTFSSIMSSLQSILEELTGLISSEAPFLKRHSSVFVAKIHVKVQQFFLGINLLFVEYFEDDRSQDVSFYLLLTKLCLLLEVEGIAQADNILSNMRAAGAQDKAKLQRSQSEVSISPNDLKSRLKASASTLLSCYIKLQSQELSQIIRQGMEGVNWLTVGEASKVAPATHKLLEGIKAVNAQVSVIFDAELEKLAAENNNSKGSSSKSSKQHGNDNKALFGKKIRIASEAAFNKNSVLSEIVKISLKSLLEYIRMKTFSKNGLHQIQVDVQFIRASLSSAVEGMDSLLDESLASATERTLEPSPLDQQTVASLVEASPKLQI